MKERKRKGTGLWTQVLAVGRHWAQCAVVKSDCPEKTLGGYTATSKLLDPDETWPNSPRSSQSVPAHWFFISKDEFLLFCTVNSHLWRLRSFSKVN